MQLSPPRFHTISLEELRKLARPERGVIVPHRVGRAWAHSIPEPGRDDPDEIRSILQGLIDDLRLRLHEEGLEPLPEGSSPPTNVPLRLRKEASSLASLITNIVTYLPDPDIALDLVNEAIGWTRIPSDPLQASILHLARVWILRNQAGGEDPEEDYRRAIAAAVKAGAPGMEMFIRSRLSDWQLWQGRTENAAAEIAAMEERCGMIPRGPVHSYYRSDVLRHQAVLKKNSGDIVESTDLLLEARREADAGIRDLTNEGLILNSLAVNYHHLGDWSTAVKLHLHLADIAVQNGDVILASNSYAQIGEHYLLQDDPESSAQAFEEAEHLLRGVPEEKLVEMNLKARKQHLYRALGEYEKGLADARELVTFFHGRAEESIVLRSMGELYESDGNLEDAEKALTESFRTIADTGQQRVDRIVVTAVPLARVLVRRGKHDEAYDLLQQVVDSEPARLVALKEKVYAHELLAGILEGRGEYREAIEQVRKMAELRLRVEQTEHATLKKNLKDREKVEFRELREKSIRERREEFSLSLAGVLTGLRTMSADFDEIATQVRMRLQWLRPEEIEQIIEVLRDTVTDPEATRAIDAVSAEIRSLMQLGNVDEAFFNRLDDRWPNLTTGQKQLCGMIRAGLETEQIAELLGVTANAVFTARKRLRKRMGLERGEDLDEVIGGV